MSNTKKLSDMNDFEKPFKDKLEYFEEASFPESWQDIKAVLDKEERHNWKRYSLLAFLTFVVITGGVITAINYKQFFLSSRQDSTQRNAENIHLDKRLRSSARNESKMIAADSGKESQIDNKEYVASINLIEKPKMPVSHQSPKESTGRKSNLVSSQGEILSKAQNIGESDQIMLLKKSTVVPKRKQRRVEAITWQEVATDTLNGMATDRLLPLDKIQNASRTNTSTLIDSVGAHSIARIADHKPIMEYITPRPYNITTSPLSETLMSNMGVLLKPVENIVQNFPEKPEVYLNKKSKWTLQPEIGLNYTSKKIKPSEDIYFLTKLNNKNKASLSNAAYQFGLKLRYNITSRNTLLMGLSWSKLKEHTNYNYYNIIADSVEVKGITFNSIEVNTYSKTLQNNVTNSTEYLGLTLGIIHKLTLLKRERNILFELNMNRKLYSAHTTKDPNQKFYLNNTQFSLKGGLESAVIIGKNKMTITPFLKHSLGSIYSEKSVYTLQTFQFGLDIGWLIPFNKH